MSIEQKMAEKSLAEKLELILGEDKGFNLMLRLLTRDDLSELHTLAVRAAEPDGPIQTLDKYFAAKDGADDYEDEVFNWLEPIGERYGKLQNELLEAGGKTHWSSMDYYPSTVTNVESYGDFIHVSGHWHRRGCTDPESCNLPRDLVYATDAQREVIFSNIEQQIADAKSNRQAEQEARERAQLENLQAKYAEQSA